MATACGIEKVVVLGLFCISECRGGYAISVCISSSGWGLGLFFFFFAFGWCECSEDA